MWRSDAEHVAWWGPDILKPRQFSNSPHGGGSDAGGAGGLGEKVCFEAVKCRVSF